MRIDLLLSHSTLAYGPDQVKILFQENQSPYNPEAVLKKGANSSLGISGFSCSNPRTPQCFMSFLVYETLATGIRL
jgi:hypothetical protein